MIPFLVWNNSLTTCKNSILLVSPHEFYPSLRSGITLLLLLATYYSFDISFNEQTSRQHYNLLIMQVKYPKSDCKNVSESNRFLATRHDGKNPCIIYGLKSFQAVQKYYTWDTKLFPWTLSRVSIWALAAGCADRISIKFSGLLTGQWGTIHYLIVLN